MRRSLFSGFKHVYCELCKHPINVHYSANVYVCDKCNTRGDYRVYNAAMHVTEYFHTYYDARLHYELIYREGYLFHVTGTGDEQEATILMQSPPPF